MESLFLYRRLCNKLKKIALQDEWSARIVKELFEQYFQLEDKLFLYMSFILVLLFEQKQPKITMTYSKNCWQTSGLSTPEYAKKKRRHEVWSYAVCQTYRMTGPCTRFMKQWKRLPYTRIGGICHFFPKLSMYVFFFSKVLQHQAVSSTLSGTV